MKYIYVYKNSQDRFIVLSLPASVRVVVVGSPNAGLFRIIHEVAGIQVAFVADRAPVEGNLNVPGWFFAGFGVRVCVEQRTVLELRDMGSCLIAEPYPCAVFLGWLARPYADPGAQRRAHT